MSDRLDRIEEILKNVALDIDKLKESQKITEKEINKVAKEIGGGLGRAAEGLTAPNVPRVFKKWNIDVVEVQMRVKALDEFGMTKQEVDLLCPARLNGRKIVLVGEVKAHFTSEDVKYFVDEDLPEFKKNFTEYKNLDVIGFISGLNVDKSASKYAYKKGLYILVPENNTMKILNPPDFKAKIW
jgi:Cu/Ag efflux pump CusA